MEKDNINRIAALDYGEKRIGIALCDPLFTFAYPFKTILNNSLFLSKFDKIHSEQNISRIILGFPIKEDGRTSLISEKIIKFKKQLEKRYKTEVILWDERYTSSIASDRIMEFVSKKKKRREKGLIDRNAAAIILQEYLNETSLKE
ncbi:MAG TPA: Holliday junction resolvase RuvX [Ignavibacteriaceae bacterium]|nr:Holliday junction resolvase RuvX [Ignavibacteriaceae bacterium]